MPFTLRPPAILAKVLRRPPFARPTRAAWAAERGRRAAESATAQAGRAADSASHAVQASAADARDRLRAAARKALDRSPFRSRKPAPAPPKRGLFWRRPRQEKASRKGGLAPVGAIEAFGFFALAAVILAWPRPGQPTALQRLTSGFRSGKGPGPHASPTAHAAAEPGRGRDAESPIQIPLLGWKDVLIRTWSEFNEDQIAAVAGGVTFFGLLAMFPALAAFVSLYGLFADVAQAREQLRLLAGFLPHDVLMFVGDEMIRLAGGEHGSLGVAFVFGLLLSLWSANGAVKALFHGLNIAYEQRENRNLIQLNLISLAFTLGGILFAVAAVGAVIVAPVVLNYFGIDAGGAWLAALRWPALLIVLILGLSALYRYGPARQRPRWRWITAGGVMAGLLWVVASLLFSWYVSNFAHYNRTYGSLGAVIGFMFWLWYSTIIVLFGAELNAELEHQTAVDSTTGPPRPLGQRGAKMADEVAPAHRAKRA